MNFPKIPGDFGIPGNSGMFGELSEFSGVCMALSMNSVGIYGGHRGNTGFCEQTLGFGRFGVILGPRKALAQIATLPKMVLDTIARKFSDAHFGGAIHARKEDK